MVRTGRYFETSRVVSWLRGTLYTRWLLCKRSCTAHNRIDRPIGAINLCVGEKNKTYYQPDVRKWFGRKTQKKKKTISVSHKNQKITLYDVTQL